jgi:hypothetical protein
MGLRHRTIARPTGDYAASRCIMNVLSRQTGQLLCAVKCCFQIVDRKVQRLCNLPRCAKSVRSLDALSCLRMGVRLFCELPQHEIRHDMAGLDGFRQGRVIPERMRKRVEDHEARINASAQIGAM